MDTPNSVININIGVLGHVDSGKTSLVKALSTALSTAALDKHPESQRRGITLDLGFSSFLMEPPEHLKDAIGSQQMLQFTLVDCPGHASLIRTIIGGAQIIDLIVLVIDINKGIQTQTAECIVLGEITTDNLIIVLNKIDMIPEDVRETKIAKMIAKIKKIFMSTKFTNPHIVLTSAAVGGEKVAAVGNAKDIANSTVVSEGIDSLLDTIRQSIRLPKRNVDGPLFYAIDHCFAIKGHGTVLTGTVLSGSVSVNSIIELPELQLEKKVKGLQMFRKPVKHAQQGDRVAICVTSLDAQLIERSIACTPRSIPLLSNVICLTKKVRFYRMNCKSGTNFHISIGHNTVLAKVIFFGAKEMERLDMSAYFPAESETTRENDNVYAYKVKEFPSIPFVSGEDYEYQDTLVGNYADSENPTSHGLRYGQEPLQWMLVQFHQPVYCPMGSLVIASKLDSDNKSGNNHQEISNSCRLAFYGTIVESMGDIETNDDILHKVKLFRWKQKTCEILRVVEEKKGLCYEAIGWKLYTKEAGVRAYLGMKLETESGQVIGVVHAPFGATDKFRIQFPDGAANVVPGMKLILRYKRYVFDHDKTMIQKGIDFSRKFSSDDNILKEPEHENDNDIVDEKKADESSPTGKSLQESGSSNTNGIVASTSSPNHNNARNLFSAASSGSIDGSVEKPSSTKSPHTDPTSKTTNDVLSANQVKSVALPLPATKIPYESGDTMAAKKAKFKINTMIKSDSSNSSNDIIVPPPTEADKASREDTAKSVGAVKYANEAIGEGDASVSVGPPSPPPSVTAVTSEGDARMRDGVVETIKSDANGVLVAIVTGAFRMEENIRSYIGTIVVGSEGQVGELMGPFAKLGKCKVQFNSGPAPAANSKVTFQMK